MGEKAKGKTPVRRARARARAKTRARASQRAQARASQRATMIMEAARAKERASPHPEDMTIIMVERARAKAKASHPRGDTSRPGTVGTVAGTMAGHIPVIARVQVKARVKVTGDHCSGGLLCEAKFVVTRH